MGLRKRHMRRDNKKGAVSAHVNNVHVEYANTSIHPRPMLHVKSGDKEGVGGGYRKPRSMLVHTS